MGDLNKLTFSEFPEAWRNDRGGLRRIFFLLVTGVMNSHDIITVSSCSQNVVEVQQKTTPEVLANVGAEHNEASFI